MSHACYSVARARAGRGEEQGCLRVALGGLMAACVRECTDEAHKTGERELKGFHRARNTEAVDDSRTQFTQEFFYTAPERRLMYIYDSAACTPVTCT